ncbi:MAG TPA: hypothetical protein VLF43_04560 [Candidatus Saccharimonadales bacterium]|nr:hypothetical protein [Candidatus Saccharimonadales bacterium]
MNTIGPPVELFDEYLALTEARQSLHAHIASGPPDVALGTELAELTHTIAGLEAHPDITQSALRSGASLVQTLGLMRKPGRTETNANAEVTAACGNRLGRAAMFVLERGVDDPELTNDPRFGDMQLALGGLATEQMVAEPKEQGHQGHTAQSIDYVAALDELRARLAAMAPGEQYKFSPTQLMTLAAPNMPLSRWQRYRFIREARQALSAEGFIFAHNNGRGRSSSYMVGRTAQVPVAQLAAAA